MDDDDEEAEALLGKPALTTFQKAEVTSKLKDMYATILLCCSNQVVWGSSLSSSYVLSPPPHPPPPPPLPISLRISTAKGALLQAKIDAESAVAEVEQARKRQYDLLCIASIARIQHVAPCVQISKPART